MWSVVGQTCHNTFKLIMVFLVGLGCNDKISMQNKLFKISFTYCSSKLRMRSRLLSLLYVLIAALAFPRLTSASGSCRNYYNQIRCEGNNCWCCQQILGNPLDPSNYVHFCSHIDATVPNINLYCFQIPNCGQGYISKVSSEDVSQQVITEITMAMKSP